MADILVQGPLSEPVSLEEAKAQLRFTSSTEDTNIKRYIRGARARIENREAVGQVFVRQTRRLILNQFPLGRDVIEIPRVPVRTIESITYVDPEGVTQIWDPDLYEFDLDAWLVPVRPVSSGSYPSTKDVLGAVAVNYTVGHMIKFTADATTDIITAAGHGLADDDIVQLRTSEGVLPVPLTEDTNFHVITATTNTLQLSLVSGGSAIDITDVGSGLNFIGVGESDLIDAMLLLIDNYFENRGEVVVGTIVGKIPDAISNLCAQHARMRR